MLGEGFDGIICILHNRRERGALVRAKRRGIDPKMSGTS
jgi:hypothetical protein